MFFTSFLLFLIFSPTSAHFRLLLYLHDFPHFTPLFCIHPSSHAFLFIPLKNVSENSELIIVCLTQLHWILKMPLTRLPFFIVSEVHFLETVSLFEKILSQYNFCYIIIQLFTFNLTHFPNTSLFLVFIFITIMNSKLA